MGLQPAPRVIREEQNTQLTFKEGLIESMLQYLPSGVSPANEQRFEGQIFLPHRPMPIPYVEVFKTVGQRPSFTFVIYFL